MLFESAVVTPSVLVMVRSVGNRVNVSVSAAVLSVGFGSDPILPSSVAVTVFVRLVTLGRYWLANWTETVSGREARPAR